MGAPLYDIAIYDYGQTIDEKHPDINFSQSANYIADFYHDRLQGYKPPKTGRICINLGPTKNVDKPDYFGSICGYDNIIDENKYVRLSKTDRYKYILDLLHSTVSEIASLYNWEQAVFDKAYSHIIESGFTVPKSFIRKSNPKTENLLDR